MRNHGVLVAAWCVALAVAGCGGDDPGASGGGSGAPPSTAASAVDDPTAASAAIFDAIGPDDPFCSAAVLRNGEVVFAEAFGSDDDGQVTTLTEVDIASVSKQFTGLAVEIVIGRNELQRSDLVGELVPASLPATDGITIEELLTHTSGLVDYGDLLTEEYDEPTTQADAVAAIADSGTSGTRGTFDYSNSNYVLLAEVVTAVAGRSLPAVLDAEVFDPLGLEMVMEPRGAWTQVGDGSIWTTPTELVRWSEQYWDQTLDGPDVATVMFESEVETGADEGGNDERYGSGVMRAVADDGAELVYHDGSWDGYETDWVAIPDEGVAAAATCNEDAAVTTDTIALDLLELWR